MKAYLGVDIGASSGRVMLSRRDDTGKITLTELHRFKNGATLQGKYKVWDVEGLLKEILTGVAQAKKQGISECTLGIDTWAVDYCLLDAEGKRLGPAIAYRDDRTENAIAEMDQVFPIAKIYEKTGIQILPFNTLFQLWKEEPQRLAQAQSLLLIPDYLNYCLTGVKALEKTNLSTTQLINLKTDDFDEELLKVLNISRDLFPPVVEPGTILGKLNAAQFPSFDLPEVTVIAIASHDTASAVLATPGEADENWAYLSSGTWSLLGSENTTAIANPESFAANYTNEGGVNHTYRFLKNIMGMWLIQEVSRNYSGNISFAEFVELAKKEPAFAQFIEVNDNDFLHPDNMIMALQNYCRKTQQKVPTSPGELARAIYDNLALCYAKELKELQRLTGKPLTSLNIVGGGCQNEFLNQLTANASGLTVYAGPVEATALGNVMMQMLATGELKDVTEARHVLKKSFPQKVFTPQSNQAVPLAAYEKFLQKGAIQHV